LDLWEAFERYVVLWLLVEGSYVMKVDVAGFSEMVMTTCESIHGLLEKYPTFGREKETGLLGALDT
jgi:hypothetical protein